jgi:hypothetical protein
MKITDVPFAVLRLQYQLARFPLQVIEHQVVARMDTEAPARLLYERSMGRLDLAVGTALGAPELEQRGAALLERSDALARAARLDTAADRTVEQSEAELKDARDAAAQVRQQAPSEKQDAVIEARVDAAHKKAAAIQKAEDRVADAKKQTDKVAAQRKNAVEAAKREEQDRIRAAERSVTAVADAKAKDAREKRSEASTKIAQANRVGQLADSEKQERQIDGTDDA